MIKSLNKLGFDYKGMLGKTISMECIFVVYK